MLLRVPTEGAVLSPKRLGGGTHMIILGDPDDHSDDHLIEADETFGEGLYGGPTGAMITMNDSTWEGNRWLGSAHLWMRIC